MKGYSRNTPEPGAMMAASACSSGAPVTVCRDASVTRLLRRSSEAVAGIVVRVVTDHVDDSHLDEVYRIEVDEVSYRKGHGYLTAVAGHDRDGTVARAGEGKSGATLAGRCYGVQRGRAAWCDRRCRAQRCPRRCR
jgi:hypothetical protein